jgi:heat shock protein HslJ
MNHLKKILTIPLLAACVAFQTGSANATGSTADNAEATPLEGTWKRLQGGSTTEYEGIYFGPDGHFGYINIYSMSGATWKRDGRQLTVGSLTQRYPKVEMSTLEIKKLTEQELVLEGDDYNAGSYQRDNGFGEVIGGKLLLPQDDILPSDALLQVRLDDVSQADVEADMVGFQLIPVGGLSSPLAWRINYATKDILPGNCYAASAVITFDNKVQYRTSSHYPAITGDGQRIFDMQTQSMNPDLEALGVTMEGMYSYYADAGLFTDCKDSNTYPVAAADDNATLESRYLKLKTDDNAKVWTRVKGKLIEQTGMEGDAKQTTLLVKKVLDVIKDKSCNVNGEPSLLGTRWHLIEVVWTGVRDDAELGQAELSFSADGRLSGSTGCNRLNGSYTLTDNKLAFGPMMTTRRACPSSQGQLEIAVEKALDKVNGFEISDSILHLWHDGVPVLRYKQQ